MAGLADLLFGYIWSCLQSHERPKAEIRAAFDLRDLDLVAGATAGYSRRPTAGGLNRRGNPHFASQSPGRKVPIQRGVHDVVAVGSAR
jgi:hypothetical protein